MKNLKPDFDRISKITDSRERGKQFEYLVMKLFEQHGLTLTSRYRTADGQQEIDGAIKIFNRIFLVEVKWEKNETLAASKLFSFIGKIASKIDGTLGIFISHEQLSANFIDAVRNGIRQNCLLIHGSTNIQKLFDDGFAVKEYLEYCFVQASLKNRVDVPVEEFLSLPVIEKIKEEEPGGLENKWLEIYKALTDETIVPHFVALLEAKYSTSLHLSKKILYIYHTLNLTPANRQKLKALVDKLLTDEAATFTSELIKRVQDDKWKQLADPWLMEFLKEKRIAIDQADRDSITNNVTEVLNAGEWEDENKASRVIDLYFDQLTNRELEKLGIEYFLIYTDRNRYETFEQKKLAKKIFERLNASPNGKKFIENQLLTRLQEAKSAEKLYYEEGDLPGVLKNFTVQNFIDQYKKVLNDLGYQGLSMKEYVAEKYDEIED